MKRSRITAMLAVCLLMGTAYTLKADVRVEQKTKFQLAGALGRVINIFGGKSAREGVTSTVAVKGDRKLTRTDSTGQIIDLAEQKVYDLDFKKKTYKVTTFAEIRQQIEEARKKAEEEAREAREDAREEPVERDPDAKDVEIDFDVKNTGERKEVNGFDTHQAIVTVTVREKGKKLEESGGLVMTSDMWLAPKNPAMAELQQFDARYAQSVYGTAVAGASPQDLAAVLVMYPQLKAAIAKMNAEGGRIDGTAVLTTVTMDAVKSAEQMAEEAKAGNDHDSTPASVGGLLGRFARRRAAPKNDGPKNRATFLTTSHEVLKLASDVPADSVAIPAGFKQD
jgi:hypothetical protein